MKEHEKLKYICDEIGYEYNNHIKVNNSIHFFIEGSFTDEWLKQRNIREIIFTEKFMDKFRDFYNKNTEFILDDSFYILLIQIHLDAPVEYLYNLIK